MQDERLGGTSVDQSAGEPFGRARRESITISYEARDHLAAMQVDRAFLTGAENLLRTCLGMAPGQTLALLTETGLEPIGAAILQEAERSGLHVVAFVADAQQTRNEPFVTRVTTRFEEADGSALVASVAGLPQAFRRRLLPRNASTRRHAHMVGITAAMMQQSMRADYDEVHGLGERLRARLAQGTVLRVESAAGTDLTIGYDRNLPWHNASGLLSGPGWGNMPGGEVVSTPTSVDGVFVPDGGLAARSGFEVGRAGRIRLRFSGGRLTDVDGRDPALERELIDLVDSHPNGRRVGQMAFGTNTGVVASIGELLQDLKRPGFHVTLGFTDREHTGADWSSEVEVPLLTRLPDVSVNGDPVMVRGRYARGLLG